MDDKTKKTFFEKIYNEIFPIVVKVSYHITKDMDAAQDVCQDAFIKLYHRVENFPGVEDAKFWLIRVVKNLSFNYLEHEKVKNRAFDKMKHIPSFTDDTGEKQLLKKEAEEKVNQALEQLPENVISRYYSDEEDLGNFHTMYLGKIVDAYLIREDE